MEPISISKVLLIVKIALFVQVGIHSKCNDGLFILQHWGAGLLQHLSLTHFFSRIFVLRFLSHVQSMGHFMNMFRATSSFHRCKSVGVRIVQFLWEMVLLRTLHHQWSSCWICILEMTKRHFPTAWSLRSPHMNACDFCLLWYLKHGPISISTHFSSLLKELLQTVRAISRWEIHISFHLIQTAALWCLLWTH